ncbi:MAG: hypothetical protein ACD_2C00211G0003 [uncultured bacterium (gcode 4)]|uniref:Methyltransferase type 11 n=1 Tax=uncultured bacterium (gcode 4) TaxID=1234023 RepID=K2GFU3_9BACT|nr:MAG: hypothetical protein ACD_2C00211G0003 [uncultured bacterium (gcode 4)]
MDQKNGNIRNSWQHDWRIPEEFCPDDDEVLRYAVEKTRDRAWACIDPHDEPVENLDSTDEIVANLSAAKEVLPEMRRIYYPCCLSDISPSKAFIWSDVIYADLNWCAIDLLRKNGFDAYKADAKKFHPANIDMVIVLSPTISSKYFIPIINQWWMIICDDYHKTAQELFREKDFRCTIFISGWKIRLRGERILFADIPRPRSWDELYVFKKIK